MQQEYVRWKLCRRTGTYKLVYNHLSKFGQLEWLLYLLSHFKGSITMKLSSFFFFFPPPEGTQKLCSNFWGGGGKVHAPLLGHAMVERWNPDAVLKQEGPSYPTQVTVTHKNWINEHVESGPWWQCRLLTHSSGELSFLCADTKNYCRWEVLSDSAKAAHVKQVTRVARKQSATKSLQLHTHPSNMPPTLFLLLIYENYGHLHTM